MDRATRAALLRGLALGGAAVGLAVAAATLGRAPDPRLVRAGHDVPSPSGRFAARVERSRSDDGVELWRPLVLQVEGDPAGAEVFRSEGVFAAGRGRRAGRSGLALTWEPGLDTLWVVSEDSGTLFVQQGPHRWTATALTRATADLVPAEVRGLTGS